MSRKHWFALAVTNLSLPHFPCKSKAKLVSWGSKSGMWVQGQGNADFYVKKQAPMEFVILFLSQFPPKNTHSLGISAAIPCHSVSQHEIMEECNYHFAQQTFLWNEREQLGAWGESCGRGKGCISWEGGAAGTWPTFVPVMLQTSFS